MHVSPTKRTTTTALCTALAAAFVPRRALAHTSAQAFLPHGVCYLWNKQLLALHVFSDAAIALSYLAISATLACLVYRERRRIPFAWIFVAFGTFIIACGATHAMDVIVLWTPLYWVSGALKAATAVASIVTAIAVPFVIPEVGKLLVAANSSRQNERRFLAASDSSNDAFYILESVRDPAGDIVDFRFVFTNANGAALISQTREQIAGRLLCELLPVNRTDGFFDRYKRVVETGEPHEDEFAIDAAEINASWLRHEVVKLEDGVAITTTDITSRKNYELELTKLANFKEAIFASSPFATIVTDLDGIITSFNPAAEKMLSIDRERVVHGTTPLVLFDPAEIEARAHALGEELGTVVAPGMPTLFARPLVGLVEEAEWRLVRGDGSVFDARVTASGLSDAHGTTAGLVLIAYDITERKRSDATIAHLAHHDALTGLPTRALFHDRLALAMARARRNRRKIGILMIDLDGFKAVNDQLGHHAGDELLVHVAERLQHAIRASDTVARLGGDEFVIVLDDLHEPDEAMRAAEKLLNRLTGPVRIDAHKLEPAASIGVALYPDDAADADELLKLADSAMYRAKATGRNRVAAYREATTASVAIS